MCCYIVLYFAIAYAATPWPAASPTGLRRDACPAAALQLTAVLAVRSHTQQPQGLQGKV